MDLDLRDNVCIVTGSTGGIGLETARLLAAEGATVVTSGRRADAPGVGEALHVAGDLGRAGEPERLVREVEEKLGRVDCLVNNVGVAVQRSFEEVTDEEWDELWHLNVMSYVRTIRAVLPAMRERKAGVIVNVYWPATGSTVASTKPSPSTRQPLLMLVPLGSSSVRVAQPSGSVVAGTSMKTTWPLLPLKVS